MNIWIRSQDKEDLIRAENVRYWNENQIVVNVWSSYNNINYVVVGEYVTRERTLEVLDEIQNCLLGAIRLEELKDINSKAYTSSAFISTKSNNLVYEMPKE